MSRGVLVIIVVGLILAIAGVALALFWQPGILNRNQTTNQAVNGGNLNTPDGTTTNQATNGDTNSPFSYRPDTLGTKQLDKRVTYRNEDIPIDRVEVVSGYTYVGPAAEGKKKVIVYLEKEALKHSPQPYEWLQEIQLLDASGSAYDIDRAQFLGDEGLKSAENYLAFEVDKKASGFTLRLVRPDEDVSLDLDI